jgi:hypothetical protein
VVAFGAVLSILGCGGQSSSSSDGSGDGRGGSNSGGVAGSDSGGSGRGGSNSGGSGRGGTTSEMIVLEDPNNYLATGELSIPTIETAPGALTVCWTDVTSDLACGPVVPERDIESIGVLRFTTGDAARITRRLGSGQLDMSDIDGFIQHTADRQSTCTELSSFSNFGTPVDVTEYYAENANRSFLFQAGRVTVPGGSVVSMVFARPVVTSTNTTIDLPPGCGIQRLVTDLDAVTLVRFPYDTTGIVHYGNLTRDGLGNSLRYDGLDSLVLSFFAGATLSDLETRILELDAIATESFELALSGGPTTSLYDATSRENGEPFSGFRRDEAGVWLLRLTCSICSTIVPSVVAVLEPF